MIPLAETHVLCYIFGGFLILVGLMSFFPKIASKIFKNASKSKTSQRIGAVGCLVLGIGLLIVGYVVFQNG